MRRKWSVGGHGAQRAGWFERALDVHGKYLPVYHPWQGKLFFNYNSNCASRTLSITGPTHCTFRGRACHNNRGEHEGSGPELPVRRMNVMLSI